VRGYLVAGKAQFQKKVSWALPPVLVLAEPVGLHRFTPRYL